MSWYKNHGIVLMQTLYCR